MTCGFWVGFRYVGEILWVLGVLVTYFGLTASIFASMVSGLIVFVVTFVGCFSGKRLVALWILGVG